MKTGKLYIFITIVITWWALTACSSQSKADIPRKNVPPEAVQKALADADGLFKEREDLDKLRAAIKALGEVRDSDNRNYQVEWTYAKYNFFLGKHSPNEDEAETALEQGRDAGKIASKVDPQKPDGHFWYAANLGELSKRSPITVGLKSVDDIKQEMNKVLEIEPGYQGASAYDALGQVELMTRLKGGDAQKAVDYFEKGLQLAPDNTNLKLHLGEAYLAVKHDPEARKQLDQLLAMKPNPDYMPEYRECVDKAKKLIATNF